MGKIKDYFAKILKGMAIGVAMIVPGISGGTLAVMLNIYDDIIEAISGARRHFKASVKTLIPIGIGGILGFAALFFPLKLGLENIPIPTICLFVGLIIGSLPMITKKVTDKPIKYTYLIILIIATVIAAGLGYFSVVMNITHDFSSLGFGKIAFLFFAGLLAACALAVPGVSGSMLLLVLGLYMPLVTTVLPEIMKFQNLGNNLIVAGTLGIGLLVGFVIISKLMSYLLKKYLVPTYYGILGFILGSLFSVFYNNEIISENYYSTMKQWWQIALAAIFLIGGIVTSFVIAKIGEKHQKNKGININVQETQ